VTEPGPGEVRVRIVVSGVNPTYWKSRLGSGGAAPPFPEVTPNQDGAGVVDAVGEGVETLQWVIESGYLTGHQRPTGTAQEYTILPAARVVRLPASMSFDIGGSLGVPAMTAHRALTISEDGSERLNPGALAGKVVLVAGCAGAVGHAAIQLARWAGATVITTVSRPEKAALATAAGAHHVVNYRDEDAATAIREVAPDGVDLVVEVAIAANFQLNIDVASRARLSPSMPRRRREAHARQAEHDQASALPIRASLYRRRCGHENGRGRHHPRPRGPSAAGRRRRGPAAASIPARRNS
jgi:NADPH2:quinone reductase